MITNNLNAIYELFITRYKFYTNHLMPFAIEFNKNQKYLISYLNNKEGDCTDFIISTNKCVKMIKNMSLYDKSNKAIYYISKAMIAAICLSCEGNLSEVLSILYDITSNFIQKDSIEDEKICDMIMYYIERIHKIDNIKWINDFSERMQKKNKSAANIIIDNRIKNLINLFKKNNINDTMVTLKYTSLMLLNKELLEYQKDYLNQILSSCYNRIRLYETK